MQEAVKARRPRRSPFRRLSSEAEARSAGGRRAIAAALTTTIAANLPPFLAGGLAVQMQAELDYGAAALGVAIGMFYVAGALSSALTGKVVEHVGAERSLRWAAAISGLLQLAIAGMARSFTALVTLLALGGLANAWAQPASNVFLVGRIPANRLGLALGLQKSAIPAAALLGGLTVPTLALTVGWRWAFLAGAMFSFASALQVPPAARRDRPLRATRRRERKPDVPLPALLLLAVGVGFGAAGSGALSAFLVLAGVEAGLSEGLAGIMLTVGSIAGMGVRLLIGAGADRHPGRALWFMVGMFAIASVAFAMLAAGTPVLFFIATPLAFATAYAWPGLFHLVVVRSNPSAPGAATGVAMTGTFTGAVSGPVIFGAIAGAGSYTAAWLTSAAFLVLAAAIVAWSGRHVHDASPAPVVTPAPALDPATVT